MEELKITKEKVLEAANKCSTAKETLKVLFPEVFKEKTYKIGTTFVTDSGDRFMLSRYRSKDSIYFFLLCLNNSKGFGWNVGITSSLRECLSELNEEQFKQVAGTYYTRIKEESLREHESI
jgi:hypothetical protein